MRNGETGWGPGLVIGFEKFYLDLDMLNLMTFEMSEETIR